MTEATLTPRLGATERRAHIAAALTAAGGNAVVAAALGVPPNAVAQWKIHASVPAAHCARLAKLSRGLFRPELIRRNWEAERLELQQLAEHAAG